jgi:hypothetical protein
MRQSSSRSYQDGDTGIVDTENMVASKRSKQRYFGSVGASIQQSAFLDQGPRANKSMVAQSLRVKTGQQTQGGDIQASKNAGCGSAVPLRRNSLMYT